MFFINFLYSDVIKLIIKYSVKFFINDLKYCRISYYQLNVEQKQLLIGFAVILKSDSSICTNSVI